MRHGKREVKGQRFRTWAAFLAFFIALGAISGTVSGIIEAAYIKSARTTSLKQDTPAVGEIPDEMGLLLGAAASYNAVETVNQPKIIATTDRLVEPNQFTDEIPLPYDLQNEMRQNCEKYGCPYQLALAVAEIESNFSVDAVSSSGDVGLMQLNPGPGGRYHDTVQAATQLDPTSVTGNIVGGVYLLGKYIEDYGDTATALIAYNAGPSAATAAQKAGNTSTAYTVKVLAAMSRWEDVVG